MGLSNVQAQQASIYSQYMFNGLAINPAFAGSHEMLSITALGRIQSVGLEGSPNAQTFSAHAPIIKNKIGVGIQVFHETLGVTDQTGIYGSYSYRINYRDFTISFGLQTGVNFYKSEFSKLRIDNAGDPVFKNDITAVTPNFGSGVFIKNKRLYGGISLPQMLTVGNENNVLVEETPFIIYGGYVIDLTPNFKLKPSTLIKMVNGKAVEWNVNANLLVKELFWVGVSFRPTNAIVFILDFQVTDQFAFGYSYDATLGQLRTIESGSHEVMLNYRFRFSQKGVISPRYF
jgi:type IX secretion system PorP/SprF family membrane protein